MAEKFTKEQLKLFLPSHLGDSVAAVYDLSSKGESTLSSIEKMHKKTLYENHAQLEIIYYGLIHALNSEKTLLTTDNQKKHFLEAAYFTALTLYYIYDQQLVCKQEANKLSHELKKLHNNFKVGDHLKSDHLAIQQLPSWVKPIEEQQEVWGGFAAKYIRSEFIPVVNSWRLLLVRIKRVFFAAALLSHYFVDSSNGLQMISVAIMWGLLSAIFYLPRLFINLFLIGKHVIPGSWMSDEEKQLDWQSRLTIQWERRGFQVRNDGVWFIINMITSHFLFFAVVPAPVCTIITVFLYVFDVWNFYVEQDLLQARCDKIDEKLNEIVSFEQNPELYAALQAERKGIKWSMGEKKREQKIKNIIGCILLAGMTPMLFLALMTPGAPLVVLIFVMIGCTTTTVTTLFQIKYRQQFAMQKPVVADTLYFSSAEPSALEDIDEHQPVTPHQLAHQQQTP